MKIAIATDNGSVSQHFGHCEGFTLYELENGAIKEEKFVPNPGHKPGFLPNFLHDLGIKTIIAGGMGGGAIDIFNEHGMEVITGISGQNPEVVQKYLQKALVSSGSVCQEHAHADSCEEH